MRTTAVKTSQSIQELLFIIAPPRHIASDVAVLKDDVQYLIGREFEDRYTPAHISLFKYADEHIDEIIEHVEAKARSLRHSMFLSKI
ncbi:MAG: hypothetical protein HC859_04105 [Bacteroidia bacterium]|nr:hypothetical protein [Bacteroidia bacterium]